MPENPVGVIKINTKVMVFVGPMWSPLHCLLCFDGHQCVCLLQPAQWKSQTKESKVGTSFSHESTYAVGNFNAFKSTAKNFSPSATSVKEVWPLTLFLRNAQHFVIMIDSLTAKGIVSLNECIKMR